MDEDRNFDEIEQPERLLAKALFHYLDKIKPNGLAVFDEITDEMFCIFVDKDDIMRSQSSATAIYDLEECEITEHLN